MLGHSSIRIIGSPPFTARAVGRAGEDLCIIADANGQNALAFGDGVRVVLRATHVVATLETVQRAAPRRAQR